MLATKLVAVINQSCEPGTAMNALAHMSFGLGQLVDREKALLSDYLDANGISHPSISNMPFIILSANSNKIRHAVREAHHKNLLCVDFINTMTGGTYVEQLTNTRNTLEENLTYYGAVFFGASNDVTELTKKFSLWK